MSENVEPREKRRYSRPYKDCSGVPYRTFGVRVHGYEWEYLKKAAKGANKTVSSFVRSRLSDVLEDARKERLCSAG